MVKTIKCADGFTGIELEAALTSSFFFSKTFIDIIRPRQNRYRNYPLYALLVD